MKAEVMLIEVHAPGGAVHPAGIILKDNQSGKYYCRGRTEWADLEDQDEAELLSAVVGELMEAAERGDVSFLEQLREQGSHSLRVQDLPPVNVEDLERELAERAQFYNW